MELCKNFLGRLRPPAKAEHRKRPNDLNYPPHIDSEPKHVEGGPTGGSMSTGNDVTLPTTNIIYNPNKVGEARLSQALRSSYVRSSGRENTVFIPGDKIEELICPCNIRRELASSVVLDSAAMDDCVSDICGAHGSRQNRRKIFAILALIEMGDEITDFIAADICDYDLPLDLQYHPQGSSSTQSLVLKRTRCQPRFIENWKGPIKELFDRYQWIVDSPCLSVGRDHKILHYDLAPQAILPFTEEDTTHDSRKGGFSSVFRVQIHPAHHSFKEYKNNTFAVKRLHDSDEAGFNREVQALKNLSSRKNDHLIPLLATYTHQGQYHLVFPWADGDLISFWKQMTDLPPSQSWFLEQMHGLATALQQVHSSTTNDNSLVDQWGRHGDIKPENILFFGDSTMGKQPRLVLSDLGLASFHSKTSRSNISPNVVGGTRTYRPPEFDLPGSKISRVSDIFSLGCVFSEIITWLVSKQEGVDSFRRQRVKYHDTADLNPHDDNFFTISRDQNGVFEAQIKPKVAQWFGKLRDTQDSKGGFTSDFLDLIEKRLLVVDPKQRANIDEVVEELEKLKLKGALDIDYFRQRPIDTHMANSRDNPECSIPSRSKEPPEEGPEPIISSSNKKRGFTEADTSQPPKKRPKQSNHISYGCPYRKRDPLKYNVRDFPGCALTQFKSISLVKKHVWNNHLNAIASRDSEDLLSQYSADGNNMGRAWKIEVDRRLRSRRADEQIFDWESLWKVLFPKDIEIPQEDYEPIIEHHEVNKAFNDRACQGKDIVLRKMHDLQSCTSYSELTSHAGVVWDSVQSYIQDQLQCKGPYTPGATNSNSSSERADSQQSLQMMRIENSRQQCGGSASSASLRRLAPRPTYAPAAPAQTFRPLSGLESVPSMSSDRPSTTTSTLPSLSEAVTEPFGNSTMPNNCTMDYPKMDDGSVNPDISSYDWTTGLDDFNFNLDFDIHVTASNVSASDPTIGV